MGRLSPAERCPGHRSSIPIRLHSKWAYIRPTVLLGLRQTQKYHSRIPMDSVGAFIRDIIYFFFGQFFASHCSEQTPFSVSGTASGSISFFSSRSSAAAVIGAATALLAVAHYC
ncbi:hypothetical protein SAY87_012162 [Trapa incisa]|uniref:Uncharacterized protein n=1 Tax=Trapa incisa TaxID=236973 RepID=A0AAN7GGT7_9MYRT|nr:hypothetical protein SAY87_012162 [Trapa incisa]